MADTTLQRQNFLFINNRSPTVYNEQNSAANHMHLFVC